MARSLTKEDARSIREAFWRSGVELEEFELVCFIQDLPKIIEQWHEDYVLGEPVAHWELSTRSSNCLYNAGISTVRQLLEKSERELLQIPHLTDRYLDEIKAEVEKRGRKLREETL